MWTRGPGIGHDQAGMEQPGLPPTASQRFFVCGLLEKREEARELSRRRRAAGSSTPKAGSYGERVSSWDLRAQARTLMD